jgi:arabinofuranosyltransferase
VTTDSATSATIDAAAAVGPDAVDVAPRAPLAPSDVAPPPPAPVPPRGRRLFVAVIALLVAGVAVAGWAEFFWQCDDAFINFRFAHNLHAGRGPVWNPPPFQPVEGYTSWLWVFGLAAVWSLTGVEPPQSSTAIALLSGLLTLLWLARAFASAELSPRLQPHRRWLGAAMLLTVASNRSFATFLSSGFETSTFLLFKVGFVLTAARGDGGRPRAWLWRCAVLAALASLTRPEGYLCAAAMLPLALAARRRSATWNALPALLPTFVVLAQLAWQRSYYGDWLPNTYQCKTTAWWPDAGARYLACFVVEHGTWVWLGAMALLLLRPRSANATDRSSPWPLRTAVAVPLLLTAYYTLRMGGDHFEYRPLLPLVPLCAYTLPLLLDRLSASVRLALGVQGLMFAAAGLGLVHHALTRHDPAPHFRAIAGELPWPLRPLLRPFDRWSAWLRLHNIAIRSTAHAHFADVLRSFAPERQFAPDAWTGLATARLGAIGILGWNLPDVAILDEYGLCDWVVARSPMRRQPPLPLSDELIAAGCAQADVDGDGRLDEAELGAALLLFLPDVYRGHPDDLLAEQSLVLALHDRDGDGMLDRGELRGIEQTLGATRGMAHERQPPDGYFEALRPNVRLEHGRLVILPRDPPLTADDVRRIEAEWRARAGAAPPGR